MTAVSILGDNLNISFRESRAESLKSGGKRKVFYGKKHQSNHKPRGKRSNFDNHKVYHDRQEIQSTMVPPR